MRRERKTGEVGLLGNKVNVWTDVPLGCEGHCRSMVGTSPTFFSMYSSTWCSLQTCTLNDRSLIEPEQKKIKVGSTDQHYHCNY